MIAQKPLRAGIAPSLGFLPPGRFYLLRTWSCNTAWFHGVFPFPPLRFFEFSAGTLRSIMIRQGLTHRGHFRFTNKPTRLKVEVVYENGIATRRAVSALRVFSEMQTEYCQTLFLFLFFSGYPSAVVLSAVLRSSRNAAVIELWSKYLLADDLRKRPLRHQGYEWIAC